jgi:hypothetical protein
VEGIQRCQHLPRIARDTLLPARFRVGNTLYRNANQGSLHQLWESVHCIDSLVHPRHNEKAAS